MVFMTATEYKGAITRIAWARHWHTLNSATVDGEYRTISNRVLDRN